MIPVLFTRIDSIYKEYLFLDCFDINRDALTWPGGSPAIYHPPCRAWGKLKYFAKPRQGEKELAIWSVNQIRKFGGVLEHPRHSSLWKEMDLPTGKQIDQYGGFTLCVNQSWFGHKAEKNTFLYICGIKPAQLPAISLNFDSIQYTVSSSKDSCKKEISKKEREATPKAFAEFLIAIVEQINKNYVNTF
jgi:hypothetical protein